MPVDHSQRLEREHGGEASGLRTDARRNLRHVLTAARDVFGEQGYDAPIEEVARRARVGVGTVYRRFPNKEALVRRIVEQEARRLTDRALRALAEDAEPWEALEGFIRHSAESGASRLLPDLFTAGLAQIPPLRPPLERGARQMADRVPQQRLGLEGREPMGVTGVLDAAEYPGRTPGGLPSGLPEPARELLMAVDQLVRRARDAGRLRAEVSVVDVLLVIATPPPSLGTPERQLAASVRLLDLLLQGLRTQRA